MLGLLLKIILTILFVFAGHFLLVYKFGEKLKKKWPNHPKIFGWKHVSLHYCGKDPSLMVTWRKFTRDSVDDDLNPFSDMLILEYGGFHLIFQWGQNYLEADNYSYSDDKSSYYGLYSVDGEFPTEMWWGNKIYDIIWFRTKHVGTYVFDMSTLKFEKYVSLDDHKPVVELTDTEYTCKDGVKRPVGKISFWFVERRYESRFLQWIGLGDFFQKKYVYLEWDTTGVGVEEEHCGYESQTLGSDILLTKEKDGELLSYYSEVTSGHLNMMGKFMSEVNKKVNFFMDEEKKY